MRKTNACLLLFLLSFCACSKKSTSSPAEPLQSESTLRRSVTDSRIPTAIPTGGNSYITAGATNGAKINHYSPYGISNWVYLSTVISTYFKVKATGALNVGIRAKVASGTSSIKLSINGQSFTKPVSGNTEVDYYFGTVTVADTGYLKLDIQGTSRSGSTVADVTAVMIGGNAASSLVYASAPSSTPGAGYYWVRRGCSLNLSYTKPSGNFQWMYHTVTVPAGFDPIGSYFMSNGFSGGYMGMQVNSATERRVLFSIWNPSDMSNGGVVLVSKGAGVDGGSFSGEGTGANAKFNAMWLAGNKYEFLTKIVPDGAGNTLYSAWFYAPEAGSWKFIATFKRPLTVSYVSSPGSFLENFNPEQGFLQRKAYYSNCWFKSTDTSGSWFPATSATFIPDGMAKAGTRQDYQGSIESGKFFMRHNGYFSDGYGPGSNTSFQMPAESAPTVDLSALPSE
ncbi:DUF3472 domain-containing protein [Niabella sp. CJ426]|uniref:DUF3472 domain-containing protein n=1 Tax=Niabella sp. CJ426 TaxID=3393740 RepID=UPI003D04A8AC